MEPSARSATVEALVTGMAGVSSEAIISVVDALTAGSITPKTTSVGLRALRGVDGRTAESLARAFAAVRGDVSAGELTLALATAHRLRVVERSKVPQIEVAWTGPDAEGPLMRPTFDVIREMISEMREGGEALIVGYSLTAAEDSPMTEVIGLLTDASRKGGQISFVLHRDQEEQNLARLTAAWDVFAVKPRVYTWLPGADAPYTKLHAKALVIDRLQVLVTSANLTFHGLKKNIELGLRVRGPQAQSIALRFDHLIAQGVLRPWNRETT
jgi:phosphatidylserine/phosphatidylglycerophosphate/cardiolipin synthase-like enzyme